MTSIFLVKESIQTLRGKNENRIYVTSQTIIESLSYWLTKINLKHILYGRFGLNWPFQSKACNEKGKWPKFSQTLVNKSLNIRVIKKHTILRIFMRG